ncbi:MAG: 5'-nucleotidase C-terminal domain-containing protein [Armatimonadetes bacterium]|nr:5'-nucleotidase C-terminal domain-containing protein [Armatimonadota bacterium]
MKMLHMLLIASLTTLALNTSFAQAPSIEPPKAEQVQVESVSPLGNKDVAKVETPLGNLAADAVRSFLRTDIAFIVASELKPKDPPFPPGKILLSDIAALVSYPNDALATLQLPGRTIKQALERAVSIQPQPNQGFLQVSGLEFTFDPNKPAGLRVTSIKVGGIPIDDERLYTVAVTNSVANGALGYWKCWSQEHVKERRPDATIVKAIEAYLRANPVIDYSKLGRIKVGG